jgi:heat shock protein HslJ
MGAGMLLLGAVGLAACQPATAPTPALPAATEAVVASPTEMPVPTAAATTDALTGNWTLVSYGPADAPVPLPEGVEVTANFANGTVSGRSGCNNYTATYVLMGDVLTITPGISTMMACEDPQMKVETEYMAALAAVTGYALPEGGLSLQFGAGQVLVFKAAASGLAGTSWDVTSYNNGKEAVVSLAVGTAITLMFADGQATGKACNNYFGPFTEDGEKVTIGPLANTRMMCVEEGVMEQEAMYMTALQAAATWSVDGSMLTLRDASGATQVVGTAATTTTP